MTHSYN